MTLDLRFFAGTATFRLADKVFTAATLGWPDPETDRFDTDG